MVEEEHGLHTSYFLGVGRGDIGDAGVVGDNTVMAHDLDIRILFEQFGVVDFLIVDGGQHDVFGSTIDGIPQLIDLLVCAFGGLGSFVEIGLETVGAQHFLKVFLVGGPTVKAGIVGKQDHYLLLIVTFVVIAVAACDQPYHDCSTQDDGGEQPKNFGSHNDYLF